MNYRHAYHAGSPVDVFKHIVLTALLQHLRRKESAFFVLDAHAAIGLYDLNTIEARKTGEFQQGIAKLWQAKVKIDLLAAYLQRIHALNPDGILRLYPGSPVIIRDHLRAEDAAAFCELHEEDIKTLKRVLRGSRTIAIHHRDAYEALGALLPPKQSRGLILIDPPFEEPDELATMARTVAAYYQKFPQAIWALWHPIKDRALLWRFEEAMIASGIPKQISFEFLLGEAADSRILKSSGMLIINPPFALQETLMPALREAHAAMAEAGGVTCKWLVPERP